MTELPAAVIRDVVHFIDEVGTDMIHGDTSNCVKIAIMFRCLCLNYSILVPPCKLEDHPNDTGTSMKLFVHIAYWYQFVGNVILKLILFSYERGVPMGKTSVEVKERYNRKTYEDIRLRVKMGQKELIQQRAETLGKSVNGYIVDLIEEDLHDSREQQ